MKEKYIKKALKLFTAYKTYKLSSKDIRMATNKSKYLDDYKKDFMDLIDMAKAIKSGSFKVSTWSASVIIATIVYVVSPIDAIPDFVPVLGWLDDVAIVGYALEKLSEELSRFRNSKYTI